MRKLATKMHVNNSANLTPVGPLLDISDRCSLFEDGFGAEGACCCDSPTNFGVSLACSPALGTLASSNFIPPKAFAPSEVVSVAIRTQVDMLSEGHKLECDGACHERGRHNVAQRGTDSERGDPLPLPCSISGL